MKILSLATLAVSLFSVQALALADEPSASARDGRADTVKAVPAAAVKPAAEDWGIWNRAPRRAGLDPLLALGHRDRAPTPEPIDAAARGDSTSGTAGRGNVDLNAWDSGRIDLPPPPTPDDGT
jgi:hypothetical protein